MKITKIELEMSEKEHQEFLRLDRISQSCIGDCKTCPLSCNNNNTANSMCFLRESVVPFSLKVVKEPLILTEGMDCSGLQLRDGNQVLGVYSYSPGHMLIVYRCAGEDSETTSVTVGGERYPGGEQSSYDVVRKEKEK